MHDLSKFESNITISQYEELKQMINMLEKRLDDLSNHV
jgi:hypothetical protein